jgi:hypothetical protein
MKRGTDMAINMYLNNEREWRIESDTIMLGKETIGKLSQQYGGWVYVIEDEHMGWYHPVGALCMIASEIHRRNQEKNVVSIID